MKHAETFLIVASFLATGQAMTVQAQTPAPTAAAKPMLCVVLPDIQMSQGTSSTADPAGPVVNSLVGYLSGPVADVQVLQAKIPVQFNAEAAQKGCGFIIESSVVHKKAGKGMAGLLAAAPALMSAVPFMGAASGGMEAYAATQVASAAVEGAAAAQAEQAQADAAAAMSGVAQTNIKKGDQITVTYKLLRTGNPIPAAGAELKAKAGQAGEDILSPLLEKLATDVLNTALQPAG